MLPKRFHDDNEPIVALKRFCIYKNRENIGAWTWNGMEQEDFRKVGVWRTSECGKMSEDCGKRWKHQSAEQENVGVWKTSENIRNVRNIRVWNRKTSETSECEIGMEIQGRV